MDLRLNEFSHLQPSVFEKKGEKKKEEKLAEEKTQEPRTAAPEAKPVTAEAIKAEDVYGRALLNKVNKAVEKPAIETAAENVKGDTTDYDTWVQKWSQYLCKGYEIQLQAVEHFLNTATDNDEKAFWHIIKIGVVQNHYIDILNDCQSFDEIPTEILENLCFNMFDPDNYEPRDGNLFNITLPDYTYITTDYIAVLNTPIDEMTDIGKRNIMNVYHADRQMWEIIDRIMGLWIRSLNPPTEAQQAHYLNCHAYFGEMMDYDKTLIGQLGSQIFIVQNP